VSWKRSIPSRAKSKGMVLVRNLNTGCVWRAARHREDEQRPGAVLCQWVEGPMGLGKKGNEQAEV
jgi:hypothetical protein